YQRLLEIFLSDIDPTDDGGQFADRGFQYTPAIYVFDDAQKNVAQEMLKALGDSGKFKKPIAVPVLSADTFYPAEDYHQDYKENNPERYKRYREGSGRGPYVKETWGAPGNVGSVFAKVSDEDLRKKLTPLQYKVTQEDATEAPFKNEYWNHKEEGSYVDMVSGEP